MVRWLREDHEVWLPGWLWVILILGWTEDVLDAIGLL